MYSRNKSGTNIERWGTPVAITISSCSDCTSQFTFYYSRNLQTIFCIQLLFHNFQFLRYNSFVKRCVISSIALPVLAYFLLE